MHSKFLIALTLFSLTAQARHHHAANPENSWQGTGLNFNDIQLRVASHCHQDETHFLGCIASLNELATYHDRTHFGMFYGTEKLKKVPRAGLGALAKSYTGGLNLYHITPQPAGDSISLDIKAIRSFRVEAFTELYKTSAKINFKTVFKDAIAGIDADALNEGTESIVAASLNAYFLAVSGPAAQISPKTEANKENTEVPSGEASEFAGVGAQLYYNKNSEVIIAGDLPGSPALAAGLKMGDVVLVDGKPSTDYSKVRSLLVGAEGTVATFQVKRGNQIIDQKINRKKYKQKPVETAIVNHGGLNFGIITIQNVNNPNQIADVTQAVNELAAQGVSGLILDLRNCFQSSIDLAGIFIGKKLSLIGKNLKTGKVKEYTGLSDAVHPELPLVTLVNMSTGYGSEYLAGTLQFYKRSWIIGTNTFGTAYALDSISPIDASHPKVLMREATDEYTLPSRKTTYLTGVTPDFKVSPPENDLHKAQFDAISYADNFSLYTPLPKTIEWKQSRTTEIARLNSCQAINAKNGFSTDALFQKELQAATIAPDYLELFAEGILSCARF